LRRNKSARLSSLLRGESPADRAVVQAKRRCDLAQREAALSVGERDSLVAVGAQVMLERDRDRLALDPRDLGRAVGLAATTAYVRAGA
jgi:hypothetical protein